MHTQLMGGTSGLWKQSDPLACNSVFVRLALGHVQSIKLTRYCTFLHGRAKILCHKTFWGLDLAVRLEHLTDNAKVTTVLDSVPASTRHTGIWGAADEAVLNEVHKKNPPFKKRTLKSSCSFFGVALWKWRRQAGVVFGNMAVKPVPRGARLPAVLARVCVRAGEVEILHVFPHVPAPVLRDAAQQAAVARPVRQPLYVGVQGLSVLALGDKIRYQTAVHLTDTAKPKLSWSKDTYRKIQGSTRCPAYLTSTDFVMSFD